MLDRGRCCWDTGRAIVQMAQLYIILHGACNAWGNVIITFFMPFDPAPCDKKSRSEHQALFPLFGAGSGHKTSVHHPCMSVFYNNYFRLRSIPFHFVSGFIPSPPTQTSWQFHFWKHNTIIYVPLSQLCFVNSAPTCSEFQPFLGWETGYFPAMP